MKVKVKVTGEIALKIRILNQLAGYLFYFNYTGRSPGQAEGLAGCSHKIARARAYYLYCIWLPLLTSLQI